MRPARGAGVAVAAFLCIFAIVLCIAALRGGWFGWGGAVADRAAPAEYVGDPQCIACHREQAGHLATAHALTSQPATAASIAGSFHPAESVVRTSSPYLHFRMDSTDAGFFQTAVEGTTPDTQTTTRRFDLVIGSGRKGQSYLYWDEGGHLFQLPLSYWTDLGRWVNSPGYGDGLPNFRRPVPARCLECHATYFESAADAWSENRYDTTTYVLGISCERCHGPGREHVERQRSWKRWLPGEAIVAPADLPRERQVELCALCHAGPGESVEPPFSYRAGEPLENYLRLHAPAPGEVVDVHGNQVALLASSACFRASDMTCSTCHDVHRPQRDAAAFSASCRGCHEVQQCGRFANEGHSISDRCVDCHMPALPSQTVVATSDGQQMQPRVRSHWIKVYPDSILR